MTTDLRSGVAGIVPIPGRLEAWMVDVAADHGVLAAHIEQWGSPVNLIETGPLRRNADELVEAARRLGVSARIYFARKANKALALVDEALAAGHGIDVASERELAQVLQRLGPNADPTRVILSAGVKPRDLVRLAVSAGVLISVDNLDELALVEDEAARAGGGPHPDGVPVALRLAAQIPDRMPTRFGLPLTTMTDLVSRDGAGSGRWRHVRLAGVHFHLDGYAAADRVIAMGQALELVVLARRHGHSPEFVDIGGGVPMAYVDEAAPWDEFWRRHRAGAATGDRLTWEGRELGRVYPVWQRPVQGGWLGKVLSSATVAGPSIAQQCRDLGLRLHLEPGRALLDGCGLTAARVEYRKQRADGIWLIGLAMNRTQCRSAADDFLIDPLLVAEPDAARTPPIEGYLVGAYCIEAELLTWRRLSFPRGVAIGDLVVWVNTAGYQMHILESASHQIPLARNLIRETSPRSPYPSWALDLIDSAMS